MSKPKVVVVMPAYNAGQTLLQTHTEVMATGVVDHVIVVDDASVDSTAAVIEEVMRLDGRVSVIRHERNIGLPAVSEYEAFRHARGEFLAFADGPSRPPTRGAAPAAPSRPAERSLRRWPGT